MGCEEIQKLSSTDPLAEYRSTPLIRSVNVKDVLGDIQTDYDNFRQGRLPQVVLNTSTLAHRCRRGRPPHHKRAYIRVGARHVGARTDIALTLPHVAEWTRSFIWVQNFVAMQ